mmetsp:Transcript_11230/g.46808  ORF Transcript_11230/g.46808 Transcript_11230/m.46808 type:complete len:215 (+) Transcript_11230:549-1193(+)
MATWAPSPSSAWSASRDYSWCTWACMRPRRRWWRPRGARRPSSSSVRSPPLMTRRSMPVATTSGAALAAAMPRTVTAAPGAATQTTRTQRRRGSSGEARVTPCSFTAAVAGRVAEIRSVATAATECAPRPSARWVPSWAPHRGAAQCGRGRCGAVARHARCARLGWSRTASPGWCGASSACGRATLPVSAARSATPRWARTRWGRGWYSSRRAG